MSHEIITNAVDGFGVLRRLAIQPSRPELCDLCCRELFGSHRHLLEVTARKVICACDPCALRFENVIEGRFKLIPRDTRLLTEFRISDAQWDSLALPINLAFFYHNSVNGETATMYPSPAGATESLLPLEHWTDLTLENPLLSEIKPDVEALLVNRLGSARDYFIAPIDVCYKLVGVIRASWRGLSGGEEVWKQIKGFIQELKQQAVSATTRQEARCA